MIPMTLAEIAAVVNGTLHDAPDDSVQVTAGIDYDSRAVQVGGIFLALLGEHVDGHDHASAAVEAGTAVVLATRPVGVPAVVVGDVLTAAADLTTHLVSRLKSTRLIGITGSSGKTSTKDLTAHVLAAAGTTVATIGNHNSEIGTAESVSRADEGTRFLVLEMGARGIGQLRRLTDMAPLDIAAVLNVGTAHIGEFGSREAIAQGKGELVEALGKEGLAVLNADDPAVSAMAARTEARVVLVGRSSDAHVRAEHVELDEHGRARFQLVTPEGRVEVGLQLTGEHHVGNALTAAAIGLEAGMHLPRLAARLTSAVPASRGRMEVVERPDGVTVINDAYNANPESMRASLTALAAMARGRRTIAVLGEMCELGGDSEREHVLLGELVGELGIAYLVTVGGPDSLRIGQAAARCGVDVVHTPDRPAARTAVQSLLQSSDVVLLKGSRAAGLQALAEQIIEDGGDR
jgi:UDP-N-acetylmuramoyl-tripeptide--D-alanyl-D-alanine ligase